MFKLIEKKGQKFDKKPARNQQKLRGNHKKKQITKLSNEVFKTQSLQTKNYTFSTNQTLRANHTSLENQSLLVNLTLTTNITHISTESTSLNTTSIRKSKSVHLSLIYLIATTAGPTLPTTTPEATTITATAAGISVKSSVLAISTASRDMKLAVSSQQNPMTIDLIGNHQMINFALKSGVTVFWSCTVVYKDEMYVYGGHKHNEGDPNQIAKVNNFKELCSECSA